MDKYLNTDIIQTLFQNEIENTITENVKL